MNALMRTRRLSRETARRLHEGVLVPTLLLRCEALAWHENEKLRLIAVEIDVLRGIRGVWRIDWVGNADVRERNGVIISSNQRLEKSIPRWYGHKKKMEEMRVVNKVYSCELVCSDHRCGEWP